MTHDRRIHADAVRRQLRGNHARRFKRQAGVMLGAMALGAAAAPYTLLDKNVQWAAGVYAYARTSVWVADGAVADPEISIRYQGSGLPRLRARRGREPLLLQGGRCRSGLRGSRMRAGLCGVVLGPDPLAGRRRAAARARA